MNSVANATEITLDYIEYSQVKNSIGLSLYGQTTPIILQSIRIFLAVFVNRHVVLDLN